jgi:hypothetical protein
MSALHHSQVGDKEGWSDNRDYMIIEFSTWQHLNADWRTVKKRVERTQQVLLYSSVNDNIPHNAVQLQEKLQNRAN